MKLLDNSEKEDFSKIIIGRPGFKEEDFEVQEIVDKPPTNVGIYAITGTVIVTRKSTGVSRLYSAGHGTNWLFDFESDLIDHVYERIKEHSI